jgi:hypothetical protein
LVVRVGALMVLGVTCWVLVGGRRSDYRGLHCQNNIRNIGLAVLNYSGGNHDQLQPAYTMRRLEPAPQVNFGVRRI